MTPSTQPDLFGDSEPPFPDGFELRDEFIDEETERVLLAHIGSLVLAPARYKAYTARRLVASFGGQFDYDANVLRPGAPLPGFLAPLCERASAWLGVASDAFDHALVAKYPPGTPIGWHRDVPDFDDVFGLSLGAAARLKLRPFGETPSRRRALNVTLKLAVGLPVAWPGSLGLAARDSADGGDALVDHATHTARPALNASAMRQHAGGRRPLPSLLNDRPMLAGTVSSSVNQEAGLCDGVLVPDARLN